MLERAIQSDLAWSTTQQMDNQKQKALAYGDVSVEEQGRRLADASGIGGNCLFGRLQGTGVGAA